MYMYMYQLLLDPYNFFNLFHGVKRTIYMYLSTCTCIYQLLFDPYNYYNRYSVKLDYFLTFSSLFLLSCSSSLCVSTSSAFLFSSNIRCCSLSDDSSSSSITSSSACSTVLPTRTSRIGFTSRSKSNSCNNILSQTSIKEHQKCMCNVMQYIVHVHTFTIQLKWYELT